MHPGLRQPHIGVPLGNAEAVPEFFWGNAAVQRFRYVLVHDIPYERNRVLAELTAPGAKSYIMPSVEVKTVVRKLTVRLRSFLGVFAIGASSIIKY